MAGNNRNIIVQKRDVYLLQELAVMRVVDREQAKRVAGFTSTTRANVRLLALTLEGLLRRFFLGPVGGARKALYALSPKGAELAQVPFRGLRERPDATLVTNFFVIHQLRINDVYCTLKYPQAPIAGISFAAWRTFHEPLGEDVPLIPDGYVELATAAGLIAAFLEVDLGHESRRVWRGKVEAYLHLAVSGSFERQFGKPQFRTLVITDSERRMSSLRAATAELTEKIFWFTTFELIAREGFSSEIWTRPNDAGLQLFLPNSS